MAKIPKPVVIRLACNDPDGLVTLGNKYLTSLMNQGYAQITLNHSRRYLEHFCTWCLQREITKATQVTQQTFEQYKTWVYQLQKNTGKSLSDRTRHFYLYKILQFFCWLVRGNYIFTNPLAQSHLPKLPRKLPRNVLTQEEVERILNIPQVSTPLGVRDRAMLETLYSTGIRRAELANLIVDDIEFEREVLLVREGKGSKDRLIPIGRRALSWIEKYLHQARPLLLKKKEERALFLNCFGNPFGSGLTILIGRYVQLGGKKGSCHLFRHTMSCLMLENGASTRYIQKMLGHANISTTEIYTKVNIQNLREIYIRTHPASLQSEEIPNSQVHFRPQDLPTGKSWKSKSSQPVWEVEFSEQEELRRLIREHLKWMFHNDFNEGTIKGRRIHLLHFADWCGERAIYSPVEITQETLELYRTHLLHARHYRTGQYLSAGYRQRHVLSLGLFFRWLVSSNHLLHNPAEGLALPKAAKKIPRYILSRQEAEKIMAQPDISHHVGLRDRAILETFYATGIRLAELINLSVDDIDFSRATLLVREGKGKKDRYVPIGERALVWIEKYLNQVRPALLVNENTNTLFLTKNGEYFSKRQLGWVVNNYLRAAGIQSGSTHLFRHTTATSMLENGADIQHVKEMLGHNDLQATQVYTKVSICKLKEVHTRTHPAKMQPTKTEQIIKDLPENQP